MLCAPGQDKWHLHVVVCGPEGDPPQILTIQLNSWTLEGDQTLILYPGDHPFIKRRTCVSYDATFLLNIAPLEEMARNNIGRDETDIIFKRHINVSDDLLKRIRDGILKTDLISKDMLAVFKRRIQF